MIKASALYIVIIIALVVGVLCSSLIVSAYLYKIQYQKKFRYDQLENNLESGINILLATQDTTYIQERVFSLFNTDADSVALKQIPWGIYDIGVVEVFIQRDTLFKTFSIGNTVDSSKWAALYLIDEDRPFSLSGKTIIRGDAYIPKAGVQEAYVNNEAYKGDKRLIIGKKHNSEKMLPVLNEKRLTELAHYFHPATTADSIIKDDSVYVSFLHSTHSFNFKKNVQILKNLTLSGNVTLFSDTTITVDSTVTLKNILVFAKAIIIKGGFHGSCQLFATDSIRVEPNCIFEYPSCLGILRFQPQKVSTQEKISIGKNVTFGGIVFTYEKTSNPMKPLIVMEKSTKINGQLYSQGILELKDSTVVNGSVFTSRFLYQSSVTQFENYLINATINSEALSQYYLSSELMPVSSKKKKVLQWLEAN